MESISCNGGDPFLPKMMPAWILNIGLGTRMGNCRSSFGRHSKTDFKSASKQMLLKEKFVTECFMNILMNFTTIKAKKLTFRDTSGLVVTVIADNYFGYCKKEVKNSKSFAANLPDY